MPFPRLDQYQLALQNPTSAFGDADLKAASVELTPMGLPKVISGGFALTYHLTTGSHQWAIRCFHREALDLEKRYAAISCVTRNAGSPYLIPIEYQKNGILVGGSWYPITKMPWLNAIPINRYIEANLSAAIARRLVSAFRALADNLARLGIAHGDLQHGNILVDNSGSLKLVDYDGMYVSELRGMTANESGHPNYQHPLRESQFDQNVDRFSILVITVALEALAADPDLWRRYSTGDNLLFKQRDFADPQSSLLLGELASLPGVRTRAERLRAIALGRYEDVPTLADFDAGTFKITARPITVKSRLQPQSIVLDASLREELVAHEGFIVTVVGRITGVHSGLTRFGQPYIFLNFGDYRLGAFTLVLWSEAIRLFTRLSRDPKDFDGKWVSVTGLITVFTPRRASRLPQPQMVIEMPSEIQVVTEAEAKDILGDRTALSVTVTPTAPKRSAAEGPAIGRDSADKLNRLYKDFASVPSPAQRATPRQTRGKSKLDWDAFIWGAMIAGVVIYALWTLVLQGR